MAMGATGHIGLGKETTWGTGVVPTVFVPATEDFSADFPEIEVDVPYGGRNAPRSDRGRPSFAGSLSGILAKPNLLGHIFAASLDTPTTAGAGPYTHEFVARAAPVSNTVAVTPYSAQVTAGAETTRWNGGQCNEFTINAAADGRVTLDSSWLFKGWTTTGLTAATPTLETGATFMHRHTAHKKGGTPAPFDDIKTLTISYANNLEGDMTQDGTDEMRAVYLGTSRLTIDMTVTSSSSPALLAEALAETDDAWVFRWEIDTDTFVEFVIPNLSIKNDPRPRLSTRGILEANVVAAAEDAGSGLFTVNLGNSTATY